MENNYSKRKSATQYTERKLQRKRSCPNRRTSTASSCASSPTPKVMNQNQFLVSLTRPGWTTAMDQKLIKLATKATNAKKNKKMFAAFGSGSKHPLKQPKAWNLLAQLFNKGINHCEVKTAKDLGKRLNFLISNYNYVRFFFFVSLLHLHDMTQVTQVHRFSFL
ncbi:uncharacterized protein LOC130735149 [Lotus japonicus]|uniref:uncharacterized protein LOC130735149 n=1 Tax=Lotus japonicus TaxID=34305 RepID=UPI0025840E97|nr:uncharacterized protein LOC130735149 [Lotus japonicus]